MSIIAISRGTFSGGEALARQVAERLGYQCLSREANLEAAAKEYGVPPADIMLAMEKRPPFWHRVIGARSAYLAFARAALCGHARAGSLVYHGFVGHLLLPGISHVIRVRVIADMRARVQAAMQQQHLEETDARVYIDSVDKERRQWVRFLFDVEWDDPHLYDVVLNLSRVSLATACETVAHLTEREEFQPTAHSVKTLEDLTVASRVSAALATDPRTRDLHFDVVADLGSVTITGETRTPGLDEAVRQVAGNVEGVKETHANIVFIPVYPGT